MKPLFSTLVILVLALTPTLASDSTSEHADSNGDGDGDSPRVPSKISAKISAKVSVEQRNKEKEDHAGDYFVKGGLLTLECNSGKKKCPNNLHNLKDDDYVCGKDGSSYPSKCALECHAGIELAHNLSRLGDETQRFSSSNLGPSI